MNNRFEYFLNATHYCLWLAHIKFGSVVRSVVNIMFALISKYCFTAEFKKKFYEHQAKRQTEINMFLYDKKTGHHITYANHWYSYFYSGYPTFLSFVLLGIMLRFCGEANHITRLFIIALPIGLCYIPAYKAVFTNDRYLKYFKRFEKKDEQWHKKWKRITIAFCIGSVLTGILGIGAMWFILLL